MPLPDKRPSSKQAVVITPRRPFMQIGVPFMLPAFCIGAVGGVLSLGRALARGR